MCRTDMLRIGSDFAFCAGLRFFSRGCEPKVEGWRWCLSSQTTTSKSTIVHLVCVIIMYTIYKMFKDVASSCSLYAIFLECRGSLLLLVTSKCQPEVALLSLVEMGKAPPIILGYDMLRPILQFSHRHVYLDNYSCLIE